MQAGASWPAQRKGWEGRNLGQKMVMIPSKSLAAKKLPEDRGHYFSVVYQSTRHVIGDVSLFDG